MKIRKIAELIARIIINNNLGLQDCADLTIAMKPAVVSKRSWVWLVTNTTNELTCEMLGIDMEG